MVKVLSMEQSKYFELHELFPQYLYRLLSRMVPDEVMWRMINPKLVITIDKIKEKFPNGTVSINNYFWGGDRGMSGLRTPASSYYSKTSQHTYFNAVDCIFSDYSTDEVRDYILSHPDEFEEIGGIEIASWLHIDVRPRVDGKIKTFSA